jgi:hypothetical protein
MEKEKGKPAPKRELTPAQLQKRKKMLVMPLFFLIFAAAMWLIFAPSGKDKEKEAQQAGLNVELPMPKDDGLVSDKRDAYEREAMQQKEQERMRSLQDFSYQLSETEGEREWDMGAEPTEDYGNAIRITETSHLQDVRHPSSLPRLPIRTSTSSWVNV